ncbi:MAG: glutathione peroxidase [Methylomonas sp.]
MNNIYSFTANSLEGHPINLENYRNEVLLIVNTASQCGFTPQYRELETLYQAFKDKGFNILGFPCNQFGKQEPGDSREIADFCLKNYGVSFPMFEKIDVNGANTHPLYQYLKTAAPGLFGTTSIKWNFTKFLIRRDGTPLKRYGSLIPPTAIKSDIQRLLKQ